MAKFVGQPSYIAWADQTSEHKHRVFLSLLQSIIICEILAITSH